MGEDASIDEFVTTVDEHDGTGGGNGTDRADRTEHDGSEDANATGSDGVAAEAGERESDIRAESEPDDAVVPTVTTYAWTPAGATCEACGATTERRWRNGDELVCSDCKEW